MADGGVGFIGRCEVVEPRRALPTYQGAALTVETYATYMNLLRSVRINMEFSGSLCRGLKRSRYKELDPSGDTLSLVDFLPTLDPPTQAKHCG